MDLKETDNRPYLHEKSEQELFQDEVLISSKLCVLLRSLFLVLFLVFALEVYCSCMLKEQQRHNHIYPSSVPHKTQTFVGIGGRLRGVFHSEVQ